MAIGSTPYSIHMDPATARQLTERGSTLLLLEVPEGTHVGINQQSFVVGPKFKGVKMLPPGPHLVSYNAVGRPGEFGPTTSFFVHLAARQVLVRRWDPAEELLLPLEDKDQVSRLEEGVRRFDFDANLAGYDLTSYNRWKELSSHITAAVIDRLAPTPSGNICITAEADPAVLSPTTAAEERLYQQLAEGRGAADSTAAGTIDKAAMEIDLPAAQQQSGTPGTSGRNHGSDLPPKSQHVGRCFYTRLPRLVKDAGLTSAQLTALNMDKSSVLEGLLQKSKDADTGIVGEFQFAFLAFLMGQSLEGFAQWKAIMHLMFGCEEAPLTTRSHLFVAFLKSLHAQLQHSLSQGGGMESQSTPLGLPMVEELLDDSFLKQLFSRFFEVLAEAGGAAPSELSAEANSVQQLLTDRLGWEFTFQDLSPAAVDAEYAPVVVEL